MEKWPTIIIITFAVLAMPARTLAVSGASSTMPSPVAKLPYAKGQSFIVTQGYDTPPTHIKKDSYALDFTQNGCEAYGKAVVAAASGTVMFASQEGYDGGYGTELIIDHGNNIVSRYAHMIPDSITVAATGTAIRQGQMVGLLGDTGLVAGAACVAHPGAHLHFAMDTMNTDGTFSAYDPEPLSGYTNMTAGKWYLSDNGDDDDADVATVPSTTAALPVVNLPIIVATATPAVASSVVLVGALTTTTVYVFSGGVSVTSPSVSADSDSAATSTLTSTSTSTSTTDVTSTQDTSDTTSTLDIATSTPGTATSTSDEATSTPSDATSTATSSAPAASSSGALFEQLNDSANSPGSWYDDNWFELGNGFAGTLNTLTLEGKVSDVNYFASQVSLQEFKDKNYSTMVQEFPISDNAPFTPILATTTFSGLSISLKPYFYYRLATVQDWQNRSVILAGTASTTVGTVMWDNFIYGTGRVESTESFYPFMIMEGTAATSTITPPSLTSPTNLTENFDKLGMQLNLSWSTSTDPDWPANPLHYEMNYSTSTTLSDSGWTTPAAIPVTMGNSYLIGVRALDNYGAISTAATTTWNFPAGFTQYLLSPQLSDAHQYFTVPSTSTLQSIQLFTTNFETGARYNTNIFCYLQVFDEYDLSSVGATSADSGATGVACGNNPVFTFFSSPFVLYPDHTYHWVFNASTGNPSTGASVQFYGTAAQTADSPFSDPSLGSARFTVTGDTGILFSN
ncbi:MAG: M23 family metallopeptidase [Minisyncoccia bacterium]|jgi:hypothetical protein